MRTASAELFDADTDPQPARQVLGEDAELLRGFALAQAHELVAGIAQVTGVAPWRHMLTPGGQRMSVAMSNCGALGWISDRRGYRYAPIDPETGMAWPAMPPAFARLAHAAATAAGFAGFAPDACLVNRYAPGTRLTLHQDRNERDFTQPIVSVSLGLPATFLFGGAQRGDRQLRVPLVHGDMVVWGGAARMRFHGVLPLKDGVHPVLGACRINLTFRKAA